MPKYDGPSYQKGQNRSNKFNFPFFQDVESVTNKKGLFSKTEQLKSESQQSFVNNHKKREERTSGLLKKQANTMTKEEHFDPSVYESERVKAESIKKEKDAIENRIRNHEFTKKSLQKEAAPFQKVRSSTPFKVQKIPSPYYGFKKKPEEQKEETDYLKAAAALRKEPETFLLLSEFLSEYAEKVVFSKLPAETANPETETELIEMAEPERAETANPEIETELIEMAEPERAEMANPETETEPIEMAEPERAETANPETETEPIEMAEPERAEAANPETETELIEMANPETEMGPTEERKSVAVDETKQPQIMVPTRETTKRRRGLSRSLAGMIEEEQDIKLNRGTNVARYFGETKSLLSSNVPSTKLRLPIAKKENKSKNQAQPADLGFAGSKGVYSDQETEDMELQAALSRFSYLDKELFSTNPEPAKQELEITNENSTEEKEQVTKLKEPLIDNKISSEVDLDLSKAETMSEREQSSIVENSKSMKKDSIKDTSLRMSEDDTEKEKNEYLPSYTFPPLSLLNRPVHFESNAIDDWVLEQAEVLSETLDAFNIHAQVSGWTVGPTVTQFELQLGRGVKVNKITNLSDDLKLALAAKDIRIEAPIPGKSTVGIEVPNQKSKPVMLVEVMESQEFKDSHSPLTVAVGVDLSGKPIVSTIDKMPHGLIAGATGSGKSVFINSLLVSLLYKANPKEVKLILIDPKSVELAPYNDIPHLLSPVISEPKAANEVLKWAVNEMEERYQKLAAAGVRNIEQFNEKARDNENHGLKLPYIVIVIDELADLMMVASNEVQDSIARITQKARAAGIHLIVATQRPSVDVITGTIKNNIPTRIAFMVSSQVDSRTILDFSGAEKLLGKGDMLFMENGTSRTVRIQGTYVEKEIEQVVKYVKDQRGPDYLFQPESLLAKAEAIEDKDELFEDVLSYIMEEGQVSASALQRKFKIGFNRAANLIDALENENLISGNKGSKPREVFLTQSDYEEKYL